MSQNISIFFRAVHTKTRWRKARHVTLDSARLSGKRSARALFRRENDAIDYEKHGEALFVVVWVDGATKGEVLRPDTIAYGGVRSEEVMLDDILRWEGAGMAPIEELESYFEINVPFIADDELLSDLAKVTGSTSPSTERKAMAMARIGQGRFRADVTALWRNGEVCALSGLEVPEMLVASHIKPWRDSTDEERLDPANGLLLAAHIDSLFDRHLLSFEKCAGDYKCVLHPRIEPKVKRIGLRGLTLLRTGQLGLSESQRFARYMETHHRKFLALIAEK